MTIGTMLLILAAFAYFMPTVMAATRGHQNTGMIFLTNLLLGWTVLGWIGALVWAATLVEETRSDFERGLTATASTSVDGGGRKVLAVIFVIFGVLFFLYALGNL
jgi:hypothetical protein